jgi:uncharacterized protein (DUF433 family)
MRRVVSVFEGCYEASRAAALAGVPLSTVYDWNRKHVVVPTVSSERPMYWSYADLMALRIVYWLRHPKDRPEATVPASPMGAVRDALIQLDKAGIDIWSAGEYGGHTTPLLVDRSGRIHVAESGSLRTLKRQQVMPDLLDLLGPFDATGDDTSGPDLRRPRPHLRIVPRKVSGEPHLARSRLTTRTVVALADRGFDLAQIHQLYPDEDIDGLREAIELEHSLAA